MAKKKTRAKPAPATRTKRGKSKTTKRITSGGNSGSFKPGNPGGPGRTPGTINKITADLKRGMLQAAIDFGSDGNGTGGLGGFLRRMIIHEPKGFLSILGRMLPMNIVHEDNTTGTMTRAELEERLRERGLPTGPIFAIPVNLMQQPQHPKPFNPGDDAKPVEYKPPLDNRPVVPSKFAGLAPPRQAAVIDHKPKDEEE